MPGIRIVRGPRKEACLASKRGRNPCAVSSVLIWLMLILFCALASCRDVATIWSTEARSPDGRWVATARTDQYGGPGTAGIISTVFLTRTAGPQDKLEVLQLMQDRGSRLELNWQAPTHLEITYTQPASVDFQAIKCGGVNISVRDVSNTPNNPSKNRGTVRP